MVYYNKTSDSTASPEIKISGVTPMNISETTKYDFVDFCYKFDIYKNKCDSCMQEPYILDNVTNLCILKPNITASEQTASFPKPPL